MIFDKYGQNPKEDSQAIYGKVWNYELVPSCVVKFDEEHRFDLSFLLGDARARKYDNQAEAVLVHETDQVKIGEWIRKIEESSH